MSAGGPDRDAYLEFGDAARLDEMIAARGERRSRLSRASEVATWTGTLHDLAERRQMAVVGLAGGRRHRGALVAVGRDHLAVRCQGRQLVLLDTTAIRSIRPEPGGTLPVATGDRHRSDGRTIVEVLGRLAEERARVVLGLHEVDDLLAGVLVGLGEDVLTIELEGGDGGVVLVPRSAIREVLLEG